MLDSVSAYLLPNKPSTGHRNVVSSPHSVHFWKLRSVLCVLTLLLTSQTRGKVAHTYCKLNRDRRKTAVVRGDKRKQENKKQWPKPHLHLQSQHFVNSKMPHAKKNRTTNTGPKRDYQINRNTKKVGLDQKEARLRSHSKPFPFTLRIVEPWSIPCFYWQPEPWSHRREQGLHYICGQSRGHLCVSVN